MRKRTALVILVSTMVTSSFLPGCRPQGAVENSGKGLPKVVEIDTKAPIGVVKEHLGRVYNINFSPIPGADGKSIFKGGTKIIHSKANQFSHDCRVLEDEMSFKANASVWKLFSANASRASSVRTAYYRAYYITDILQADTSLEMRDTIPDAKFFLTKIFLGYMYEARIEGDKSSFHAGVKAELDQYTSIQFGVGIGTWSKTISWFL